MFYEFRIRQTPQQDFLLHYDEAGRKIINTYDAAATSVIFVLSFTTESDGHAFTNAPPF